MPSTPNFRRLHFSLKDRVVSFLSEALFENMTYTVRHGLIRGMKRKGGMGFLPAAFLSRPQNQPEEDFLRSLDLAGKVVYDIGAFHGIMTLFFSRQAKAVVAYEPHPANFRRLQENINLNRLGNVTAFNRGIGECEGVIELACDPRMPGAASGDPAIGLQLRNSLPDAQTMRIGVYPLDHEVERHNFPLPDLVKIDIEGMELSALRGMKNLLAAQRPQLYLEMHGATESEKERKAVEILDFLARSGYGSIRHVETGATITRSDTSVARAGHLFCVAS
jgi:FkbM family methyltransferase